MASVNSDVKCVKSSLRCGLQTLVISSSTTSDEIRVRCVSVTKLASFPRGAAVTQEEALSRDVWDQPDGCLWVRYLCCRACVHCHCLLITGIHHPQPPYPSFFVWSHWREHMTHSGTPKRGDLNSISLKYETLWQIGKFTVISSLH